MGFRFSLEHANWLAHILQPTGATPRLEHEFEQRETLQQFVQSFTHNFYTTRNAGRELERFMFGFRKEIDSPRPIPTEALNELREYFRGTPWVALLLPSGDHKETDQLLTKPEFLQELVRISPDDPGLILQLDHTPENEIALDSVFPAFKIALAEVTRWPGLLLWTPIGDAAFFELSKDTRTLRERLQWIFSRLATHVGSPDLQFLKQQFAKEQLKGTEGNTQVKVLHMSDLHLGSSLARRRMARVQTLVESVVRELGEDAPIVPVITGDLMDTPSDENLGDVRAFMGFLKSLGVEKPIIVLGNHDVREDGWRNPQFEQAVNISRGPVVWMDEHSVGFACLNSVNKGHLARGWIGEDELTYVGNALDEYQHKQHFTILAALHHHPIPVDLPSWYRRAWYERILGGAFEKTEELKDSELFLDWLKLRGIQAVLHGHKHIPRFDKHGDIAIIGCGSTVGKVETEAKGQTYMSLNVLTIDRASHMLGCRLRAERIPGAGLESLQSHELVMKSTLP